MVQNLEIEREKAFIELHNLENSIGYKIVTQLVKMNLLTDKYIANIINKTTNELVELIRS